MKKVRTKKREVIVLSAVYCGFLSLVLFLPESHPALFAVILSLYALVSYIGVERFR